MSQSATTDDPIVVSGIAVEAPGGIDSPAALWSALAESRELITPFPRDRGWPVDDLLAVSRSRWLGAGSRRLRIPHHCSAVRPGILRDHCP